MVTPISLRMTAEEYRKLPETTQRAELIEGEVVVSLSAVSDHQRSVRQFIRLIDDLKPDGEVFFTPMDVYLDDVSVFQPDVFWIAAANENCVEKDGYFYGAPDPVIEVLSPSTARYDKTVKFLAYEKHGVREYWLADPKRELVEVWKRDGDSFVLQGTYGAQESFISAVLGDKSIDLTAIFG